MRRAKYSKLTASAALWCCGLGLALGTQFVSPAAAADAPRDVLRRYLEARWRGDVTAAEALWDAGDLRRSTALGTTYEGIEARFDDNLLWSAEDRAAAPKTAPAVADSSIDATWAHYTVLLPNAKTTRTDSLAYVVAKTPDGWRVSSPYEKVAANWSLREGRYVRVHAMRLRDVNRNAVESLDAGVEQMFKRLATPDLVRLRLERLKIEYYLCHTPGDVHALVGSRPAGYQLAGERVVSLANADLNGVARAVLHASLRNVGPNAAPWLEEGTAAVLGGWGDWAETVVLQRGAALGAKAGDLDAVLDARAFAAMKPENAVPLAAAWAGAVLDQMTGEKFPAFYAKFSASAARAAAFDAAAMRQAVEVATGKSGPALTEWVRVRAAAVPAPMNPGCKVVPAETRGHQPVMRWRDAQEKWTFEMYDEGDEYVVSVGPYQGPMPVWTQALVDSLARARGETVAPRVARPRPAGDPPQLAILIRERVYSEPEAYESPLFLKQFTKHRYAGDLFGLFITPDEVRLWDYRRDVLLACHATGFTPAGGPKFYDEAAGRICFRLRHDFLPQLLEDYTAATLIYTGE